MRGAKLTGILFCLSAHHQDRSAAAQEQYNDGITSVNAIGNHCQIDCWHKPEGREYDDLSGDDPNEESDRKQPADSERLQ
jgi:hypothetical protein